MKVKLQVGNKPDIYNSFLDIMKDFKIHSIETQVCVFFIFFSAVLPYAHMAIIALLLNGFCCAVANRKDPPSSLRMQSAPYDPIFYSDPALSIS